MAKSSLEWSVVFARSARKELENLDLPVSLRVLGKIERLQFNPRPAGCKKLAGNNTLWRLRVGNYRIVYSINETINEIDIVIIRHRNNAYENL